MRKLNRIRKGVKVSCVGWDIGSVGKIIYEPGCKIFEFFTVKLEDKNKEVLIPIESIQSATESKIHLNCTKKHLSNLPDISKKEVCNDKGYVYIQNNKNTVYGIGTRPSGVIHLKKYIGPPVPLWE